MGPAAQIPWLQKQIRAGYPAASKPTHDTPSLSTIYEVLVKIVKEVFLLIRMSTAPTILKMFVIIQFSVSTRRCAIKLGQQHLHPRTNCTLDPDPPIIKPQQTVNG